MAFKMKGFGGFKETDMSKLRSKQARARKGISEYQHFKDPKSQGDEPRVEGTLTGKKKSPMEQNGDKLGRAKNEKKATKDTRTSSQKAADKRDLERQTRIYNAQEKSRKYHRKREKKELKEKGYYTDVTDGKRYEHVEEMRGTGKNRKMTKIVREKRD